MNDLVEYIGNLENRVKALETENTNLRAIRPKNEGTNENSIARSIVQHLPQSNLLSQRFLKRVFAVWGHFFIAAS